MNIVVASICKQEEDMIRPWLETLLSLEQIVDIHIFDTGSTDATLDYIKAYKDSRIKLFEMKDFKNFSAARNYILKTVEYGDWIWQPDIDEIPSANYKDLFDHLLTKDFSGCNYIYLPHIKMFDFDKIWFHTPPVAPYINRERITYSWEKDTTTLFRRDSIGTYSGDLHERISYLHGKGCRVPFSYDVDIQDLPDEVFIIHYSKAKLHAEARRTGKSFEYCVGKKRMVYRRIQPVTYFGKLFDAAWCDKATEEDIEELGRLQMKQFIEVEGHIFSEMPFDVRTLNNSFVKKYNENA